MRKHSGFTVVELLVVIALIGTIAAIAIPNFISWLPDYRLRSAAQDLYSNFQKAKLTAVKRNTNCTVRFDSTGYSLFVDNNQDFIKDAGEDDIVQVVWADYKDISVALADVGFPNNAEATPVPCMAFQPSAIPTDPAGGFTNGTVDIKNSENKTMSVIVSQAGSIRIE